MENKKVTIEKLKNGKTRETDDNGNFTIKDESGKTIGFGVFAASKGYSNNKLKEKIIELQNSGKIEEIGLKEVKKEEPIDLKNCIEELPKFNINKKPKKHKYEVKKFYDKNSQNER